VLTVLNKVDALEDGDPLAIEARLGEFAEDGLAISALTGEGVPHLLEQVSAELYADLVPMKIVVPYKDGQLISLFHEQAVVEHVEHLADGVTLEGRVPSRLVPRFKAYIPKAKAATKRPRASAKS
jgi:GTP-binding protein HflX